jgi:UPF0176 protein
LTVSGQNLADFQGFLAQKTACADLQFKDASTSRHPFNVFKVKVKDEIVTLGRPDLAPSNAKNSHLSPREWKKAMAEPGTIVVDTRNDYEVDLGRFRGAVDFRLQEFREFPEAVREAGWDKSQKVLMYCTGGIRCEKAILAMQEQGFSEVYQLEGGILNFLREFPHEEFEGECFVFDYRVAVDQDLRATTRYKLCPHCGQPGEEAIHCTQCQSPAVICSKCQAQGCSTCSKNCAHHQEIGSNSCHPQKPGTF